MFMHGMKQQGSHQYTKRQGCYSEGPQHAGEIRLKTNLEIWRQRPTPRTDEPHAMNSKSWGSTGQVALLQERSRDGSSRQTKHESVMYPHSREGSLYTSLHQKRIISNSGQVNIPLYLALVNPNLEHCAQLQATKNEMLINWKVHSRN